MGIILPRAIFSSVFYIKGILFLFFLKFFTTIFHNFFYNFFLQLFFTFFYNFCLQNFQFGHERLRFDCRLFRLPRRQEYLPPICERFLIFKSFFKSTNRNPAFHKCGISIGSIYFFLNQPIEYQHFKNAAFLLADFEKFANFNNLFYLKKKPAKKTILTQNTTLWA